MRARPCRPTGVNGERNGSSMILNLDASLLVASFIEHAGGEEGFFAFGAFVAVAAVFVAFGVDAGEGEFKGEALPHHNHVFFFKFLEGCLDRDFFFEAEREHV